MRAASLAARPVTALVVATLLLALGCAGRGRPDLAPGDPPGHDLAARVDTEAAQRLLAELLERRSLDPRFATPAPSFPGAALGAAPAPDRLPDQARLRDLAQEVSLDFAALTFAHAISGDQRSRAVQVAFERALAEGGARSEEALARPGGFPYTVLFAPSWMYRTHPGTGADFAPQRRLLDRLAIANRLIETGESASVEDNAAPIAAAVRATGPGEAPLVLVSASKSGAEVALALSRLLEPGEAARVAAWVNIVGALGGSPLADSALRPPASWLVRAVFWLSGWNWAGLTSMATGRSRERLAGATLPDSIAVVNVVAVPVSGSVGAAVWFGYMLLRRHGPNDGVVLLADTVWQDGMSVVTLGADHLYAPRKDDTHGLALLRAVDVAVRLHNAGRRPPASVELSR